MTTLHPYQFGRKRQTSHEKGKVPVAAMTKRRGKVEVSFIEDKAKRQQVRHTRKNGLFKKALEYATMTGDDIKLEIRDEYFDSKDATTAVVPTVSNGETSSENNNQPSCSNATLSPKAVKTRVVTNAEIGIQCSLVENLTNNLGNDRHCRVCGKSYESDTRKQQKLWIGCESPDCDYWLEARCLLGDSKKITAQFCNNMPYLCPFHRK